MNNYENSETIKMDRELSQIWPGWRVVRLIGRGGYGSVYEIHRSIGSHLQRAALKVIRVDIDNSNIDQMMLGAQSPDYTDLFYREFISKIQNEIVLMQQFVGNSHIISYEDHFIRSREDDSGWDIYIRMELLTGLPEYLRNHQPDEKMVLKLGMDISQGLSDCHREGIIHRDIKPQNIFINKSGNFKIGDFGVSRLSPTNMEMMSFKGTVTYMAPEVFYRQGTDARSEIYSLGMVMYQLMNDCRLPFLPKQFAPEDIETVREMRLSGNQIPEPAHGSPELKGVVCKALELDPEDRFQTADELYEALELISRGGKSDAWKSVPFHQMEEKVDRFDTDDFYDFPEEEPLPEPEMRAPRSDQQEQGGQEDIASEKKTHRKAGRKQKNVNALNEWDDSRKEDGRQNLRKFLPFAAVAAVAVFIVCLTVKLFLPWFGDYVIDWKDPVLEAKMREITGIETRDIKYSDVKDIKELHLDNDIECDLAADEKISDISALKNLDKLTVLTVSNNRIQDISALGSLTNLNELDLSMNQISDISALENLTELELLHLNNNQITDVRALNGLVNLKKLYLYNNQITNIKPLENLTGLTTLYLSYNRISDTGALNNLTSLNRLTLSNNQISRLSFSDNLASLQGLWLSNNRISSVSSLDKLTGLKELHLYNNQITSISELKKLTNLEFLSISKNQIEDYSDLRGMNELKTLYLSGNEISDISFLEGMTNLECLKLSCNQITDIEPLTRLTNLTELFLNENQISDISPLINMRNLSILRLEENQIRDLTTLSGLTNLTVLTLYGNIINTIEPLENLTNLEVLYLNNNNSFEIKPLNNLTNLKELNLSDGYLDDLSALSNLKNLEKLYLNDCYIEDVSFLHGMTDLNELWLNSNNITNIESLSNLINLKELYLHGNGIEDISALKRLTNLTHLDLSMNQIQDISALTGMSHLHYLDLNNNPITDYLPINSMSIDVLSVNLLQQSEWGEF